jgi:hypothetical protein
MFFIRNLYRLIKIKNCFVIVWDELIDLYKKVGWHFGQFENEQYIETSFQNVDGSIVKFHYRVTTNNLLFKVIVLSIFHEDRTNDIMVLDSHFNGLLNFGKVKVSLKYNYVAFEYSGDLVPYMFYPCEIHSDISTHYFLAKDCIWAFSNLVETGDNPVFVFSSFLKQKEENVNEN